MPAAGRGMRRAHRGAQLGSCEGAVVEGRIALAGGGPGIQVRQLHIEHCRLQLIDAEIAADQGVVVLGFAAVHPQHAHALGERRILGDAHAGIAEGAQVLGREKRQAADVTEAAGAAPCGIGGADGLGGILDDL